MLRLICFEGKKHFRTPLMTGIILIFFALNAGRIYAVYLDSSIFSEKNMAWFWEPYQELYKRFGGSITDEKITELMSIYLPLRNAVNAKTAATGAEEGSLTYNKYSDELFLRWCFVEEMEYDYTYQEYADSITQNCLDNMAFYARKSNNYEYRKNLKIAKAFYKRQIPDFCNTEAYQYFFYYDFSSMLILGIVLYGVSMVFIKDREAEMDTLIKASKAGGRKTVIAKIISAWFFIIMVCAVFFLEDYLLFMVLFHGKGAGNMPIYALEGFRNCPVRLTLLKGVLFGDILKMLGFLSIGTYMLMISCFLKRILPAVSLGLGSIFTLVWANEVLSFGIRVMNPASLISFRKLLLETDVINLAGFPIFNYEACILLCLVHIMAGICAILAGNKKG